MPHDMTVPNTILAQLGGHRFTVMTGIKAFAGGDNALSFRIGRNPGRWTHCRISLTPNDLYEVSFLKYRKLELVESHTENDVYAEDLQSVFTYHTGLDTHL